MRKVLPLLALALAAAGCARSDKPAAGAALPAQHAPAHDPVTAVVPSGLALARMRLTRGERYAALPDRGELLTYPDDGPAFSTKAYTWKAVSLSEAHAFNAIGGTMTVTAPGGQLIRLRYDRHIEHPDGNWTWVGRPTGAQPGVEAIITFGDKAVFGTIPDGTAQPLRLMAANGRTWMVQTDARALATLPAAHPTSPDAIPVPRSTLIPPDDMSAAHGAAPVTAAAPSSGGALVDVVLGYTVGFASRLGGQSQANTRLAYMIDIANQAYQNSGIDGRLRLVATVQVNYADTTENNQALYDLTGYDCSSKPCVTRQVPAALQPLRNARDQYGADVVSLVRTFDNATNGNCGVGWIPGSGQTPIDSSDAPFAMSVVSDSNGNGQGSFPSGGYVCRDETLAHEIGHNMGSTHDRGTAQGSNGTLEAGEYGRYPYSFGYKTGSSQGNFYTVMAYGEGGQTTYRVFSNPSIAYCGGQPCGAADTADNARSLNQTMPIIAGFRATVVPVAVTSPTPFDFDADGKSDLLWRDETAGVMESWLMSGSQLVSARAMQLPPGQRVVTTGDFNGDRRADLLLLNNTRDMTMWFSGTSGFASAPMGRTAGIGWIPLGGGDFDGDGKSDLLWRNEATGSAELWLMNGSSLASARAFSLPAGYRVAGLGDFDGNGKADLFLTGPSRDMIAWLGDGSGFVPQALGRTSGVGWKVVSGFDFDGDGKTDLLWKNEGGGQFETWLMNGAILSSARGFSLPAGYRVFAAGDYNGDSKADLLLTSAARDQVMWFGNGTAFSATDLNRTYAADWTVGPQQGLNDTPVTYDFDGNGLSDLIWMGSGSSGEAWSMVGAALKSAYGFTLPSGYRVMTAGDFDGDGRLDLFSTGTNRDMVMHLSGGKSFAPVSLNRTYDVGWVAVGHVDVNTDGKSDLIWRSDATGLFETWVMDGPILVHARAFQLPAGYRIAAYGDFDGSGRTDLLTTSAARDMVVWWANPDGGFRTQSLGRSYGQGWRPRGGVDFDGDQRDDLLWVNDTTGVFETWLMDGPNLASAQAFQLPSGYGLFGTGDYNGDGRSDLFITSTARDQVMWFRRGASFVSTSLNRSYGVGWSVLDN